MSASWHAAWPFTAVLVKSISSLTPPNTHTHSMMRALAGDWVNQPAELPKKTAGNLEVNSTAAHWGHHQLPVMLLFPNFQIQSQKVKRGKPRRRRVSQRTLGLRKKGRWRWARGEWQPAGRRGLQPTVGLGDAGAGQGHLQTVTTNYWDWLFGFVVPFAVSFLNVLEKLGRGLDLDLWGYS